jgi:hypothetical protein
MTSRELSAWLAYFTVKGEEIQHERDKAESKDGQVLDPRLEDDEYDEDDDADNFDDGSGDS